LEQSKSDRDRMTEDLEKAHAEHAQAAAQAASALEQATAGGAAGVNQGLEQVTAERDRLAQDLAQAMTDRDDIALDLRQTVADRDRLAQDLKKVTTEREVALRDLAEARRKLEKSTKALELAKQEQAAAPIEKPAPAAELRPSIRDRNPASDRISVISRQVAESGQTLSTAAHDAERTDSLIRELGNVTSRIGDAERLLGTVASLATEDADATAIKGIQNTNGQASIIIKEIVRMIDRIKGTAVEIADASSTHALATTADLLEKSEQLRGMLDDLVNRIHSDDRPQG